MAQLRSNLPLANGNCVLCCSVDKLADSKEHCDANPDCSLDERHYSLHLLSFVPGQNNIRQVRSKQSHLHCNKRLLAMGVLTKGLQVRTIAPEAPTEVL